MTIRQYKGETVSDKLILSFAGLCLLTYMARFWKHSRMLLPGSGFLVAARVANSTDGNSIGMFLAFANFRNLSRKDCPAFASSISDATKSSVSARLVASNMAFTGPIDAADIDRP